MPTDPIPEERERVEREAYERWRRLETAASGSNWCCYEDQRLLTEATLAHEQFKAAVAETERLRGQQESEVAAEIRGFERALDLIDPMDPLRDVFEERLAALKAQEPHNAVAAAVKAAKEKGQ